MMFFLRVYFHPITTPVVVENTSASAYWNRRHPRADHFPASACLSDPILSAAEFGYLLER